MPQWIQHLSDYLAEHALDWLTKLAIFLVVLVVGRMLSRLAASGVRRAMERTSARTLAPMMSTLVQVSLYVATVVMALDQLGLDVTTVLAGAGVLGLAIGFGAQTLVKDCISGFFLVLDEAMAPGDWVELDGRLGQIESVGLRMTRLRAFDGTLFHVPNGEVKIVGNKSRGWMRAIVTVSVAYEEDLERAIGVLQQIADRFAEQNPELVFAEEPPVAQGALGFDDSSIGLRLVVRMKHDQTGQFWAVERQLRREIKQAFEREDIEIPYPRRVMLTREAA